MPGSPRSSKVVVFPKGTFFIQSIIAGLVLDIESGFLKDPLKAGARVELAHRKAPKSTTETSTQVEQQLWKMEENYIVNVRTGHVLDVQGGVIRAGSRVIQNVRKTGKDASSQLWANDDGVLTLMSNPKFVVGIDGDAARDGTKITLQEKKAYNEKQKWSYINGTGRPASPSPTKAETISIRPDNFPTSWFYIKSQASKLVVDIEHGYFTDPMKAGARAEMNHQKIDNGDGRHSLLELQLWRYEAGFLINRRTGLVLDVQGGTLKLSARVIQWQRKSGKEAQNQHWFYENGFICNVYNSRMVLDIDGDGTKDGAKIAVGERKETSNEDQKWILEEARFGWLAGPVQEAEEVVEETTVVERAFVSVVPAGVSATLPTSGWFYIRSKSSGMVVDIEEGPFNDVLAPNVLVNMNKQVTSVLGDDFSKIELQLWRYDNGMIINRRTGYVLDCKQGVVRYGARIIQNIPKDGKEAVHQRWASVDGALVVQSKPTFAIDIEGDGSKVGSRLSLQRPKAQNNADQQWEYELASFDWLKIERTDFSASGVITVHTSVTTNTSSVVQIQKNDWFFIKSAASGLVMDLEAGWITSPTDVGAYISMKKQRTADEPDQSLLERQLWRYDNGYLINRRTGYVIDIYGRSAVVGVKLIQQYKSASGAEGELNQLWNIGGGNISLVHNDKLVINSETNRDGSRVQLTEAKSGQASYWALEIAQFSWLKRSLTIDADEVVQAEITSHTDLPSSGWFYIKSHASSLVLDIEHGFFRNHLKAGAYVGLNQQKLRASANHHALLELQLWRFEDGFIINRRTGLVLDVSGGQLKSGSKLIQWSRKTEGVENQQWAVSGGFIHLKHNPSLVLDVDGDGTRDGSRISLQTKKNSKTADQRWSFEQVYFHWLAVERDYTFSTETDVELMGEYETSHLARVREHTSAPEQCWFYLKTGISDLVLEVEHGRTINHLKSGTTLRLAHQRLQSGKHSHALLELQLWRFEDGYIVNRRTGHVLAVNKIENNATIIQTTKTGAREQRWVVKEGALRLAASTDFAIFISYGHHGSKAFVRKVRVNESAQTWSFAEVSFSWLTLERKQTVTEIEVLESDVSETSLLELEAVRTREIKHFSKAAYFHIRAPNGHVVDIEHGWFKNHMRAGAYARLHPQTTAASAHQHAILDLQLWTHYQGYLINKRTGLALTVQGDLKQAGARLVQELPQNAIKWTIQDGFIYPEDYSNLVLNVRDDYIVLVERTVAITWVIYEVTFSWLVWTEATLLTTEKSEDIEFNEEFEEIVVRSGAAEGEVIEYGRTKQWLTAPADSWFYITLSSGKVMTVDYQALEKSAHGAAIKLTTKKTFTSAQRHALAELQLWKLEGSYIVHRFTGLYLTVEGSSSGSKLVLAAKSADASLQQWQFSEDGALYLASNKNQVIDFVQDSVVIVARSSSQTTWLYDTVKYSWLTSLDTKTTYNYKQIEYEVTQFKTVYTRYITYITKYTVVRTITRTIRIIRVHPQVPLKNVTVHESNGTIWACNLLEAGTRVSYVMQLLYDRTTTKYYIYTQWGSIEGQVEGPYETVEHATTEFQEIYSAKVGFEWSERSSEALSSTWTTVEVEYDEVTIDEDSEDGASTSVVIDTRASTATTTSTTTTKPATKDIKYASKDQVDVKVNVEVKKEDNRKTVVTAKPKTVAEKKTWWFRGLGTAAVASAAAAGLVQVGGLWKRSKNVLFVRKAQVDVLCPIKETSYVYYDETVYDEVLIDRHTNITYHQQLLFNRTTKLYYIYLRWGESEYTLSEGYKTVESAKSAHKETYRQKFGVTWEERETTVSEQYSYEVITYETVEETIVEEEIVSEEDVATIVAEEKNVTIEEIDTAVEQIVISKDVSVETATKTVTAKPSTTAEKKSWWFRSLASGASDAYAAGLTQVDGLWTRTKNVLFVRKAQVDALCPIKETSYVYYDETVYDEVLIDRHTNITYHQQLLFNRTTKLYYIYLRWGESEYTLSEGYKTVESAKSAHKETYRQKFGVTWEERETTVSEQYSYEVITYESVEETIVEEETVTEEQVATIVAEQKNISIEEIETIVEETTTVQEKEVEKSTTIVGAKPTTVAEKKTWWFRGLGTAAVAAAAAAGVSQVDGLWKKTKNVLFVRKAQVDVLCPIKETSYVYYDETIYDEVLIDRHTNITYHQQLLFNRTTKLYYIYLRWGESEYTLSEGYKTIESAKSAHKETYRQKFGVTWEERETTVSEQYSYEVITYEAVEETVEEEVVITEEEAATIVAEKKEVTIEEIETVVNETTVIEESSTKKSTTVVAAKPTTVAEKKSWWFRNLASGASDAYAAGLTQVDGLWRKTKNVLLTRKAHVDALCPIKETSYVYYDETVYDEVLIDRQTNITYHQQMLYDRVTKLYYIYLRWGESEYTLSEGYKTVESAKSAHKETYQTKFGVSWEERETTVSEQYSYEVITYESWEETVEEEEIISEEQVATIVAEQKNISIEEIETVVEETVIVEESTGEKSTKTLAAKPTTVAEKKSWWFRNLASGAADAAAAGLTKADGFWKKTKEVLFVRKAQVDVLCPIKETSYVYYDETVYDEVLTDRHTNVTYHQQLLFDRKTQLYYIYLRWGESQYTLSEGYKTVESAKSAHKETYRQKFGVTWEERETTVSEQYSYEVITYESVEETVEEEVVITEEEVATIVAEKKEVTIEEIETVVDQTIISEETVLVEEISTEKTTKAVAAKPKTTSQKKSWWFRNLASGASDAYAAGLTQVDGLWKKTKEVLFVRKAQVDVLCPIKETSYVYYDETVYDEVLTDRHTNVTYHQQLLFDRKTQLYYIYLRWGESEYTLSEGYKTVESAKSAHKETYRQKFGVTWEERETTVSEQYSYEVITYESVEETVEEQVVITEEEVATIVAEKKEVTIEEIETVVEETTFTEEIAVTEESSASKTTTIAAAKPTTVAEKKSWWFRNLASGASDAYAAGLTQVDGLWKKTKEVLFVRKAQVDVLCPIKETSYVYYDETVYDEVLTDRHTNVTYHQQLLFDRKTQLYYIYLRWGESQYTLSEGYKTVESAKSAHKETYRQKFGVTWEERETTVSEQYSYEVITYESVEETVEEEVVITEEEVATIVAEKNDISIDEIETVVEQTTIVEKSSAGKSTSTVVEKPTTVAEKKSWWFRNLASGAADAAAAGLTQVDGLWRKSKNVLLTRKAHVDALCPIKETSYVYYDETVYDEVLIDRHTNITYHQQMLYDRVTKLYYIYLRWGESEYTLSEGYKTVESAKSAHKETYQTKFGVSWEERETTVSEQYSYEVITYESFEETVVEVEEEIVSEEEVATIVAEKKEVTIEEIETVVQETIVSEATTTDKTTVVVAAKPKTVEEKKSWWFRNLASGASDAYAAGLTQVDGLWKRTKEVLFVRKAQVDVLCPIKETSYVYYDEDVYDEVLIDKHTNITYHQQLLFDRKTQLYYIYLRWGESRYSLSEGYKTVESAKTAHKETYQEKFGVSWEERETTVSEQYSYEVITYESVEETVKEEVVITEEEVATIVAEKKQVSIEEIETIVEETVIVEESSIDKSSQVVVTKPKTTGEKKSWWFRGLGVAAVATAAAAGISQVDGLWKKTKSVLFTRKAHVDALCPIKETSYVYYDETVYDEVLIDRHTNITYHQQMLYDRVTKLYYIYLRWGESEYTLSEGYKTVESAKSAHKETYQTKFGVSWEERETTVSEQYSYEVITYESFEETVVEEEIVTEEEVATIVAEEKQVSIEEIETIVEQTVIVEESSVKHVEVEESTQVIVEEENVETSEVEVVVVEEEVKEETVSTQVEVVEFTNTEVTEVVEEVNVEVTESTEVVLEETEEVVVVEETEEVTVDKTAASGASESDISLESGNGQFSVAIKETKEEVIVEEQTVDTVETEVSVEEVVVVDESVTEVTEVSETVLVDNSTTEILVEQEEIEVKQEAIVVEESSEVTETVIEESSEVTETVIEEVSEIDLVRETSEVAVEEVAQAEVEVVESVEETQTSSEVTETTTTTTTTTTTSSGEIVVESSTGKDVKVVAHKPVTTGEKKTWWFRSLGTAAVATAAAAGLVQVGGLWKKTKEVLFTRKAHVDVICPIKETSYVYYDEDVYDEVLIDRHTNITYHQQMLYDRTTKLYYIYLRWGESEYTLSEGYKTVESAKSAHKETYQTKFGVSWEERETTVSEQYSYEVVTYETFEETVEEEVTVTEEEVATIVAEKKEITIEEIETAVEETIIVEQSTVEEQEVVVVEESTSTDIIVEQEQVELKTEVVVEESSTTEVVESSEVIIVEESATIATEVEVEETSVEEVVVVAEESTEVLVKEEVQVEAEVVVVEETTTTEVEVVESQVEVIETSTTEEEIIVEESKTVASGSSESEITLEAGRGEFSVEVEETKEEVVVVEETVQTEVIVAEESTEEEIIVKEEVAVEEEVVVVEEQQTVLVEESSTTDILVKQEEIEIKNEVELVQVVEESTEVNETVIVEETSTEVLEHEQVIIVEESSTADIIVKEEAVEAEVVIVEESTTEVSETIVVEQEQTEVLVEESTTDILVKQEEIELIHEREVFDSALEVVEVVGSTTEVIETSTTEEEIIVEESKTVASGSSESEITLEAGRGEFSVEVEETKEEVVVVEETVQTEVIVEESSTSEVIEESIATEVVVVEESTEEEIIVKEEVAVEEEVVVVEEQQTVLVEESSTADILVKQEEIEIKNEVVVVEESEVTETVVEESSEVEVIEQEHIIVEESSEVIVEEVAQAEVEVVESIEETQTSSEVTETTTTTTTTTTTSSGEVVVETSTGKDVKVVAHKPVTTGEKKTWWFRSLGTAAVATAAAAGLVQVGGLWKKTKEVLFTRKAHVDVICPIKETSYVYYDEDVYDEVLIDRHTNITYHQQMLYDRTTKLYYIYLRWGESEYTLSEGYKTVESAKSAHKETYQTKFGVSWEERETTVSEQYSYEVVTYETFEETVEEEVTVTEEEVATIVAEKKEITIEEIETAVEETIIVEQSTVEEQEVVVVEESTSTDIIVEQEQVELKTEVVVEESSTTEVVESSEVIIVEESATIATEVEVEETSVEEVVVVAEESTEVLVKEEVQVEAEVVVVEETTTTEVEVVESQVEVIETSTTEEEIIVEESKTVASGSSESEITLEAGRGEFSVEVEEAKEEVVVEETVQTEVIVEESSTSEVVVVEESSTEEEVIVKEEVAVEEEIVVVEEQQTVLVEESSTTDILVKQEEIEIKNEVELVQVVEESTEVNETVIVEETSTEVLEHEQVIIVEESSTADIIVKEEAVEAEVVIVEESTTEVSETIVVEQEQTEVLVEESTTDILVKQEEIELIHEREVFDSALEVVEVVGSTTEVIETSTTEEEIIVEESKTVASGSSESEITLEAGRGEFSVEVEETKEEVVVVEETVQTEVIVAEESTEEEIIVKEEVAVEEEVVVVEEQQTVLVEESSTADILVKQEEIEIKNEVVVVEESEVTETVVEESTEVEVIEQEHIIVEESSEVIVEEVAQAEVEVVESIEETQTSSEVTETTTTTTTTTTTSSGEVVVETSTGKDVKVVAHKPVTTGEKKTWWFRSLGTAAVATAAAAGLVQVGGLWKKTKEVLFTRKAHVDVICPIKETSYVYYDEDVYDEVLIDRHTNITYHQQMLYDRTTKLYYIYLRWGESEYTLSEGYKTVESAKSAHKETYQTKFGVSWEERETTVSEQYSYEVVTYETFEETVEEEVTVTEEEVATIVAEKKEITIEEIETAVEETIIVEQSTVEEQEVVVVEESTSTDIIVEQEQVELKTEVAVEESSTTEVVESSEVIIVEESATIATEVEVEETSVEEVVVVAEESTEVLVKEEVQVEAEVVVVEETTTTEVEVVESQVEVIETSTTEEEIIVEESKTVASGSSESEITLEAGRGEFSVEVEETKEEVVVVEETVQTEVIVEESSTTEVIEESIATEVVVVEESSTEEEVIVKEEVAVEEEVVVVEEQQTVLVEESSTTDILIEEEQVEITNEVVVVEDSSIVSETVVVEEEQVVVVEESSIADIIVKEEVAEAEVVIVEESTAEVSETVVVEQEQTEVIVEESSTVEVVESTVDIVEVVEHVEESSAVEIVEVVESTTEVIETSTTEEEIIVEESKTVASGSSESEITLEAGRGEFSVEVEEAKEEVVVVEETNEEVVVVEETVQTEVIVEESSTSEVIEESIATEVVVVEESTEEEIIVKEEVAVEEEVVVVEEQQTVLVEESSTADILVKQEEIEIKNEVVVVEESEVTETVVEESSEVEVIEQEHIIVEESSEVIVEEVAQAEVEVVESIEETQTSSEVTETTTTTTTTTTTSSGEVVVETSTGKDVKVVAHKPVTTGEKKTWWFRSLGTAAVATAAAAGLVQVGGLWKKTKEVLFTRKAHVDVVCPIKETSYVYYDEDVYDEVLIDRHTNITYHQQMLYDRTTKLYYIYLRWGESEYTLSEGYKTVESAKSAHKETYQTKFGVSWEERETTVSEQYSYEVVTYETFEETVEEEVTVTEEEVATIVAEKKEITIEEIETAVEETIIVEQSTVEEQEVVVVEESTSTDIIVEQEQVELKTEVVVEESSTTEVVESSEVIVVEESATTTTEVEVEETSVEEVVVVAEESTEVLVKEEVQVEAEVVVVEETTTTEVEVVESTTEEVIVVEESEEVIVEKTAASGASESEVSLNSSSGGFSIAIEEKKVEEVIVEEETVETEVVVEESSTTEVEIVKEVAVEEVVVVEQSTTDIIVEEEVAVEEVVVVEQSTTGIIVEEEVAVEEVVVEESTIVKEEVAVEEVVVVEESSTTEVTETVVVEESIEKEEVEIVQSQVEVIETTTTEEEIIVEESEDVIVKKTVASGASESDISLASGQGGFSIAVENKEEIIVEDSTEVVEVVESQVEIIETTTAEEEIIVEESEVVEKVVETEVSVEDVVEATEISTAVVEESGSTTTTTTTTTTTASGGSVVVESSTSKDVKVPIVRSSGGKWSSGWFRGAAAAIGGAAAIGVSQVDGLWKKTKSVLFTRKAHVDAICPIKETSYVYYDEDVYDEVLIDRHTNVTYHQQMLYDRTTKLYYIYLRWGESEYTLSEGYKTVESAKSAHKETYQTKFGVSWEERETTISEQYSYEVVTYESFEETVVEEEIIEESEAKEIIEHRESYVVSESSHTEVLPEDREEITTVITTTHETGIVVEPVVSKETSWFRRIASGVSDGAHAGLQMVDGVWKRAVEVVTTRKAHVDTICPIKNAYVYYDEDVYDEVLIDRHSGVTYHQQMLYDHITKLYYIFLRWGESEYTLSEGYSTVESAKSAHKETYQSKFGVSWEQRETTVSERWSYEVVTYEAFEEVEVVEEIVSDYEVSQIVTKEEQVIVNQDVIKSTSSTYGSQNALSFETQVETENVGHRGGFYASGGSSYEAHQQSSSRSGGYTLGGPSSSTTTTTTRTTTSAESKKDFLAELPQLINPGINIGTGAVQGVIDNTSGTSQVLRTLPDHVRPRAWVSLHVGGWKNAPHELNGFLRLDDQSGERLMEQAREASIGTSEESLPIDGLRLPEIVATFAKKLYGHFGHELPQELTFATLSKLADRDPQGN